ncbi:MAG: hypothetical protein HKO65_12195 [Gemmatimonadetes bacterium]|nr:hypothetical protein [Gemmatimonadota bacterium]NNM05841.1 hypothetical protein [Gemmatimonadota bacterium]
MGEGRIFEPRRLYGRLMSLLLLGAATSLSGCDGDTLYDAVPADVDPPEISVDSPTDGAQVQAGQRVPIQLSATDAEGVSTITVRITGAVTETITIQFVPPGTEVQADTAFTVPADALGNIQIAANAVNTQGVQGQADNVGISITTVDGLQPSVSLSLQVPPRMEMTDLMRATVRAFDNPGGSGIASTGLTAIVTNTSRVDTLVLNPTDAFVGQASDTAVSEFSFSPPFVDPESLPDTLNIVFFGIAYDNEGNCGGAVEEEFTNEVSCSTVPIGGTDYVIANAVTGGQEVIAVTGRTSPTPGGGTLADLLIDTLRSRVYVSNLTRNRIQTLEADPGTWGSEIFVGADPWGLDISQGGDSLFVANSGGTSISFVSLIGAPREDLARRYVTQNTPLFEVTRTVEGTDSLEKLDGVFYDFSDRPQFIARDAMDRLLYSTKPTASATDGTIRVVTKEPGWTAPEAKILLLPADVVYDSTKFSIAHVDSVDIYRVTGGDDLIEIHDHKVGFPAVTVSSGVLTIEAALAAMSANPDSDIFWIQGAWVLERLALQDTTFVTASGDREWVAFGEGGTGDEEAGRITLWDASAAKIHRRLLVADLLNNASERVTGLDLNVDGTLGAARGNDASYYWSTDLRLQGSVPTTVNGGAGAALHPYHPSFTPATPSSENTLSFVGQADYTIRILDTTHFTQRGELHIRDMIVGPLKAGPPLPTDNDGAGGACVGDDCVVVKLYGITDGGGVVVVDVRRRDIDDVF